MSLSTNAFAALQKTSKKDKKEDKKKKSKKSKADKQAEALEHAIFSQPSISVSNWADCDTDDDDFHAAPLPSLEGLGHVDNGAEEHHEEEEEEEEEEHHDSDAEAELEEHARWDEVDDHDHEDEHEDEGEKEEAEAEVVVVRPVLPAAEPEKQMSKKELKKKEMEDLDAVLNELGLAPASASEQEKAEKKKKKKDKKKQVQEAAENAENQPPATAATISAKEAEKAEEQQEDEIEEGGADAAEMDPDKIKAQLAKKAAKGKGASRPKSGKISSIAAKEAKARAAKGKKKDTSSYNQAPTR